MDASKSKIIPRAILFVIIAVIVYFSMNRFPGMVKIAAPIVCGGEFSVQIKAHEYCYICRDGSGAEEDITSKTYYTALFINTVIAYAMLYILGFLIRYAKNKKGKNSFEDFQNQNNKNLFQSSSNQNQQAFFHQQTAPISGDLELKIINELRANRKINAIKICRDSTGLGLKDAKDKVEEIERTNGIHT